MELFFEKKNDTSLEGGPRHDRYKKGGEKWGPLQIGRKIFTGESGVYSGSLPIRSYNLQHL